MISSKPLVLAASLAVALLAPGCVDDVEVITLGLPRDGESFRYEGEDGSIITISFIGHALRSDGYGSQHDSVILEFLVHPSGNPTAEIPIEEAVDVTTGLHVRHDVLCEMDAASWECLEWQEVFFAAAGIPGALGMAPFWGRDLKAGPFEVPVSFSGSNQILQGNAAPVTYGGRTCLQLAAGDASDHFGVPWMQITSAFAEPIVCTGDVLPSMWVPDRGFPTAYSSLLAPRYYLAGRDMDGAHVNALEPSQPVARPKPAEVAGQLAVLSGESPVGGWPARAAHEQAVEMDQSYADFLNASPPGMVTRAYFKRGHTSTSPLVVESDTSWTFRAVKSDGSAYETQIQRTSQTSLLEGNSTSYSIIASGGYGAKISPVPPISYRGFSGDLAYQYGQALFEGRPNTAVHHFEGRHTVNAVERVPLSDRFITTLLYTPTNTPPGASIILPWIVQLDSKDGQLTYVRLPADLRLSA